LSSYSINSGSTSSSDDVKQLLNVIFTKPSEGNWSDYKVVVVMSDDTSDSNGQTASGGVLTLEPDLNMQYLFSFFTDTEFRFVHSKGAVAEANSSIDYLVKSSTVTQYSWDNETSTAVVASNDIRQGVHTVIYDVYMKTDGGEQSLKLPFEGYNNSRA